MVTGVTYRHPAVLAKMAVTVDHISGGRLEFGLGAGWHEAEHRGYGIPFPPAGQRVAMLDEALQVIKALWTEDTANFGGTYFRLEDSVCNPKPVQKPHPPIIVAARRAHDGRARAPGRRRPGCLASSRDFHGFDSRPSHGAGLLRCHR